MGSKGHVSFDSNRIETSESIKRHISDAFGFSYGKIVLMEATYQRDDEDGKSYCSGVSFRVCGIGYEASLFYDTLDFAPIWNK